MLIHLVFTAFNIFRPLVSMILASLANSTHCLGRPLKYEYKEASSPSTFDTRGYDDKISTTRFKR
jgi:hypothetical protein